MNNLTIVVPFWNGHKTFDRLVMSLPPSIPLIVVTDYGSDLPQITRRMNTTYISLQERGYFSGACNAGFDACSTDVLVLNQDVWFDSDDKYDKHHAFQIISELQEGVHDLGTYGEGVLAHPAWPGGYVQGTFMYMSRKAIDAVGGFNAVDYPLWGATAEWQLRACRKGFRAIPVKSVPGLRHEERKRGGYGTSITTTLSQEPEKKQLFIRTPPAISVVIPCFNYGNYLPEAVDSLMQQTFQSFEVIIVDDASRDNSAEVALGLADKFKGIRTILHKKNQGTPVALNTGVDAAYGKFITVLSADDKYAAKRLETLYRVIEKNPTSVVYDHVLEFGEKSRHRILPPYKAAEYDFEALLNKNFIHAGMMYAKSAWKAVGGYATEMKYGREDWAFAVALGAKGYCGIQIQQALYLYRDDGQGRHHRNSQPLWRGRFQQQMIELFPKLYAGERDMACCGKGARKVSIPSNNTPVSLSERDIRLAQGAEPGDVRVSYIGTSVGTQTIYGPSRRRYKYGRNAHRIFVWVANEDLEFMLQTGMFKLAPFTVKAQVVMSKEEVEEVNPTTTQPDPVPIETPAYETVEVEPQAVEEPTVLYENLSVGDIQALDAADVDWQVMLELEEAGKLSSSGKARKSALNYIRKQLVTE